MTKEGKISNSNEKLMAQYLYETNNILNKADLTLALEYAWWTEEKARIKFQKEIPDFPITNNFIYWCNLGINIGSEQNKVRPVVIIRTQMTSPICTILPLTSTRLNDKRWYHIDLEEENSTAMIEQVKNISKLRILKPKRVKGKIRVITINDFKNINKALSNYYKLETFPKNKI